MPCLSYKLILTKRHSATNVPKNVIVCNIRRRTKFLIDCLSKGRKEIDIFLLFKQNAIEKIMELSTAVNFLQWKHIHLLGYSHQ